MHIVTDYVHPDEGCWGILEGPQMLPHGKSFRRRWVQYVFVVRDGAKAKYILDLGDADYWEARALPQAIAGLGDDTVAELQEWAERDRLEGKFMQYQKQLLEESTLIEDSLAGLEQEYLAKRNRTTIGPHVFAQRGDYPGQFARREIKERINGRTN